MALATRRHLPQHLFFVRRDLNRLFHLRDAAIREREPKAGPALQRRRLGSSSPCQRRARLLQTYVLALRAFLASPRDSSSVVQVVTVTAARELFASASACFESRSFVWPETISYRCVRLRALDGNLEIEYSPAVTGDAQFRLALYETAYGARIHLKIPSWGWCLGFR